MADRDVGRQRVEATDMTERIIPRMSTGAGQGGGARPPAGWSEAEMTTLAAIAETFVRGGATRRAALAAEALDRAGDPDQVRQLRLVLRMVESRAANVVFHGRPVRFRDLAPAARERYLLSWATSRLGLRRSAFQGLKRLLTFLAYADPGDETANPLWAEIGYRPDDRTPTAQPTRIRAFQLPRTPADDPIRLDADVVIVGSGAGGGVMACELARAGRSVVVLEAGPLVSEADMPSGELAAYDRLYLDHGLSATWDGAVSILAGAAVGGGTLVNFMTSIAAPVEVRAEWARDHGVDGMDGPQWDADAEAIERELGVTETATIPPKDAVILRGAAALGIEAAPIRRNAGDCTDCGSCHFGCPRGEKQSGIRAHLADAFDHGARIVPDAHVDRVLIEGDRAAGVEATVRVPGEAGPRRLLVRAPQVVVAAGALRTPAVLERSGIRHPALGRHLLLHPTPVVAARFGERIDQWRGPMQAARSTQFVGGDGHRNGYVIESAPGHPGLIALAFPWTGTDDYAAVMGQIGYFAPLVAVMRDGGEGRVRLTSGGRVRVDYRLDARGVATARHATASMVAIARAAGALGIVAVGTPGVRFGSGGSESGGSAPDGLAAYQERLSRVDFGPNRMTIFSAHQMGTARMGSGRRDHVCDPTGQVRRGAATDDVVQGLYVADASLFPTGLGVNPMITIMVLARRVSRTVLAQG